MSALRATALLAVLLAGCAPSRQARTAELPVQPRSSWSAEAQTADYGVAVDWWTGFRDEQLNEYVAEALIANPSLAEAEARVRAAAALARIAGAELYPFLNAGLTAGRSKEVIGFSGPFGPTFTSGRYGVALNLSWELDVWGRIRAGQRAATEDLRASHALFYGVQLSLAAQTSKAYFATVAGRLQTAVAEEDLASARSLEERIRERFQSGLRTALDVKLAETEVSRARASLALRRRVHDASLRQLENLLGRYPAGQAAFAKSLPEVVEPVPAGIPADVLRRRPDLVAAERQLVASAQRIVEAEASLYPRVSLTASGGLASTDVDDLLSGNFGVWSLVLNMAQPIFEGGRLRANIDLQEAREDEAVAVFGNAVLSAFREVETALVAERRLAEQEAALAQLVDEAGVSVELSEERFLSGLASILSVLEARRRHFLARSELLEVHRQRLEARIDLYAALGGGFETRWIGIETTWIGLEQEPTR
jgi:NodT family efflux transporter outer membrane factor (OMF) lipoprotein